MKEIQEDFALIEPSFRPEVAFARLRIANQRRKASYYLREKPYLAEALRRSDK